MKYIQKGLYNGNTLVGHFDSEEDIHKYIALQERLGENISEYSIREKKVYI